MTKKEQIDEMLLDVPQTIVAYDANPKGQHLYGEQRLQIAEALYDAGYRKVDEFEECRKCPAWSGTDCTRNPYTEGCLDDKVNLKNEIKRLKNENACLLKAREEHFTFDTTQNKKYSIFNTVRKEFADRLKLETIVESRLCVREYDIGYNDGYSEAYYNFHNTIDELLKEYEK